MPHALDEPSARNLALGILTVTQTVHLWHVYVFAFLLGCVSAFDAPARHIFVSELVGKADLTNALVAEVTWWS